MKQKRKIIRIDITNPKKEAYFEELKALLPKTSDSELILRAIILAVKHERLKRKLFDWFGFTHKD